jgi:hypothetical protein
VKSLTSLWSITAQELAVRCCTSATRDIKTVASRYEHEGLWFLAVTLADLGKTIEKWLDQGFVGPSSDVPKFKWDARLGRPRFLGGFLDRVFVPGSGVLLDNPDVEAIYALRQLTLMFGKIEQPAVPGRGPSRVVTPEREARAMSGYVQCEQDVKVADARLDPLFMEDFRRVSAMLYGEAFDKLERDLQFGRLIPKHGPGSVADRLTVNGRWSQRTWTARLQSAGMLAEEFLLVNKRPGRVAELQEELDILEPGAERPVRVISVPKTLKTPRIIAIEPAAMQYSQQALARSLLSALREDGFLAGAIGTDNQDPNRFLARLGSLTGDLATLDLSEASDRVSNQHVLALFDGWPGLSQAIQATRSRKADVPGHGVQRLAKFASMGSALTFPVEAMVFLTIILLGIERELGAPLAAEDLKKFSGRVRVFGDDLIVPRDNVLSVYDELHNFGYVVNAGKSFWTGRFRESCGKEYYDGHDVSIVRVRQVLPTTRQDASGVISAVAFRNQAYWSGLWQTARWMDAYIKRVIKYFPNVAPSSPLLGRESALGYQFDRLHPATHGPLTKGYYVSSQPPRDNLEGEGALLKCLARKAIPEPYSWFWSPPDALDLTVETEHLERTGRPKRVNIKLGTRSPF